MCENTKSLPREACNPAIWHERVPSLAFRFHYLEDKPIMTALNSFYRISNQLTISLPSIRTCRKAHSFSCDGRLSYHRASIQAPQHQL